MITFEYTAREPKSGKKVKSTVQAESEQAAAAIIKREGMAPVEIKAVGGNQEGFKKYFNRITTKDKILFSRQLSTLINAGLPLVQSLRSVGAQATNQSFKVVISEVIRDVEAGASLSAALERHPKVFNDIFVSLVAAGEVSGTLDRSLERLATQQEKDAEILSKVRGAMVYPAVVVFIMLLVVGFMVVRVVPEVKNIYESVGSAEDLPFITKLMIGTSDLIRKYWLFIAIAGGIGGFFMTRWARTLGGKQAIDKFKMRAPLIGPLFMKMYMARFARTSTTLVGSGVPLLQVLDVTSRSINNVHIENSLHQASDKVKSGVALSDAISNNPNFLELVPNMLRIGEQSGSMEDMLAKVADYYEKEVDTQIKAISTIIEPVLMIVLGVVAFAIVAAVLLPIYGLANKNFF